MADDNPNPFDPLPSNSGDAPVGSSTPPEPSLSALPSHSQAPAPPQPTVTGDGPSQSQPVLPSPSAQGGPSVAQHSQAPQQPSQTFFAPPTNPFLGPQQGLSLVQRQVVWQTGTASVEVTPEMLNTELDAIPPPTLAKLKRKIGMAGQDLATMTFEEKTRLVHLARRGATRPPNSAPGLGIGIPLGQPQLHAQPMHPPLPPAGLATPPVYATRAPGLSFTPPHPMLGHGLATGALGQHPMGPPGTQPGSGMFRQQDTHTLRTPPPNMPQRFEPQPALGLAPPPGTPGYGPAPAPRSSNHWESGVAGLSSSAIPTPAPNLSTPQPPVPHFEPFRRTGWSTAELELFAEAWAVGVSRSD